MHIDEFGPNRRTFLQMVGAAGGATAVYETMVALGLLNEPAAWGGPPRLRPDRGRGRRVVILGAGIGALATAFELTRAGYCCQILEAQGRPGGRNLTARCGTKIVEHSADQGITEQTCLFDDDLYVNMGPARIPHHHRRVLHYCSVLNVPLDMFVMSSPANLFQNHTFKKAITRRRIEHDTRGYIAELLAKARVVALDQAMTGEDNDKLKKLLLKYGDLNKHDYRYEGSDHAGCRAPITVHEGCKARQPLALGCLLQSEFWNNKFYSPDGYNYQPTLFQPKNGMDEIIRRFCYVLGHIVQLGCVVTSIMIIQDKVEVEYFDRDVRRFCKTWGHYCISSIPLHLLKEIPANFSDDFRQAIEAPEFKPACKVAWQANRRFWEADKYQIYGGISYTDHLITQLWYPSNDYFSSKGTLLGAYNYDEKAEELGKQGLLERLQTARQGGALFHSEFYDRSIVPDKGISIAWQNVPFQRGSWVWWRDSQIIQYQRLLTPDRRFFIIGDQVSQLDGWQEGALMSAEHVIDQIDKGAPFKARKVEHVPAAMRAEDQA